MTEQEKEDVQHTEKKRSVPEAIIDLHPDLKKKRDEKDDDPPDAPKTEQ